MGDRYDLAVIGAGSGGIGAALAGARAGLSVVLIEEADGIGGTAVRAGVNVWEPSVGGTGIPYEIYRRLKRIPNAVGVCSIGRHCLWPAPTESVPFPGGESVIDPTRRYRDTLRRHGARSMREDEAFCREHWHGVVFEPEPYVRVVERMLADTGRCTVMTRAAARDVELDAGHITAVVLDGGRRVESEMFVDSTGDADVAAACGCELMMGQEARDWYQEPHAPAEPTDRINAVTLIYRVTRTDGGGIEPLAPGVASACWWGERFPVASFAQCPCGDRHVNMLPTMAGEEFLQLGYQGAYTEACRRVRAHWHHNQTTFPELRDYRLSWVAPALGVRESRRIVAQYVLSEHDLDGGLSAQRHPDIIAIADHGKDTHGYSGACGELGEPYGVPLRCLVPRGVDNLLVACRAAGFSSIAASSCRLSRTMVQLGQAAGTAAAMAVRWRVPVTDLPTEGLRQNLRDQHVQLDWPTPPELQQHLDDEDADV